MSCYALKPFAKLFSNYQQLDCWFNTFLSLTTKETSASLTVLRRMCRWLVDSSYKGPVMLWRHLAEYSNTHENPEDWQCHMWMLVCLVLSLGMWWCKVRGQSASVLWGKYTEIQEVQECKNTKYPWIFFGMYRISSPDLSIYLNAFTTYIPLPFLFL